MFEYYPDISDSKFDEKIYKKKEYYIHRKKYINDPKELEAICEKQNVEEVTQQNFELLSQQKMLQNYISPFTPYKNLLIFHGVGTGKTCTSISIAEGFRDYIRKIRETTNKRPFIYIIAASEAENNFKKELFGSCPKKQYITDAEREKLKSLSELTSKEGKMQYESYRKQLESRLTDPSQGGYYRFMGYRKFQNRTLGARFRTDTRKLIRLEGDVQRKHSRQPIENLDDSILIIDEAHNIKADDWTRTLKFVIARSKNLRVILLTATPMKNKPTEIIELLNFLLPKERKLKRKQVFDKDKLLPKGLDKIREAAKGVVSYLRGVNPYTFPERIEEGTINEEGGFKHTKLVRCVMHGLHLETYNKEYDEKLTQENRHLFDMVLPNL